MRRILALCHHDLRTHQQAFALLGIIFGFFLLRFPSLFEPYWYGDEGIYQVVGMAIREGRLLYQGVWDNKPPLLYLLYALANGDLFSIRLLALVAGVLAVLVFFFVSKAIFKEKRSSYLTTILFAILFGLPLLEGNIANAENFMLLPILACAWLVLKSEGKLVASTMKQLFIAGVLLSTAFLMKIVALFDFAAFSLFILFVALEHKTNRISELKQALKKNTLLGVGFIIPILAVCTFFLAKGIFGEFLSATLSQNIQYIGYGNALFGAQGFLFIKLTLLAVFILLLFLYRVLFTKMQIFIMLWLALSLFNAFFAQRPYTHYLLILLPSICLLVGEVIKTKKFRFTGLLFLIFLSALIPKNFWIYAKTLSYYQNFISFTNNQESVEQYQAFFDQNVPGYYEAAQFISTHTSGKDDVFIWSDAAQVYAISKKLPPGRLTAAYHITFYPQAELEMQKVLDMKKPKYIILLMPISKQQAFLHNYVMKFILSKGAVIYERAT